MHRIGDMSTGKRTDISIVFRIKDVMAKRKLTMRELANRTNIPYRSLQNYLLGKHDIPSPLIGKIAEAMDTTTDWLILEKPPHLDKEILEDNLPLVEDFRVLSEHKLNFSEIAELFISIYTREFYAKNRPTVRQESRSKNKLKPD